MVEATTADESVIPVKSLRSLVILGSAWTFFGYGTQQVIRLGSQLMLTRWLTADIYGVMALVNVFLQGLHMFTDLGIGLSVIQNPRGEEPSFLRVAWTAQVMRGFTVFCMSMAIAYPLSWFYGQHALMYYLPVAGITALMGGFNSTGLFLLNRRIEIGVITLIDLASQIASVVVMMTIAFIWHSVWALLVGGIVSSLVTLAASHLFTPAVSMRFEWEKDIAAELVRFGRWIFVATLLTFIVGRADRLVLGKLASLAELGAYSVAAMLNGAVCEALQSLSSRVLFPVYSRLASKERAVQRRQMLRVRFLLTAVILPPYLALTLWAPKLIAILHFKESYHDLGWMLQILAAGSSFSIINVTISPILLSVGDSFRHMVLLVYQSIAVVLAMFIGAYFYGIHGFVIGIALCHITTYPVLVLAIRKYGVWLPALDFAAFAVSAAVCAIAFMV